MSPFASTTTYNKQPCLRLTEPYIYTGEGKPVTAPGAPAPPKHKWSDLVSGLSIKWNRPATHPLIHQQKRIIQTQALHFLRREGILPPHDDAPAKTNDFVGGPYVCEGSVGDEGKWRV